MSDGIPQRVKAVKGRFVPEFPDECEPHTPCPDGYLARDAWAEKMAATHVQRQCKGCGLWAIWEPAATPPPVHVIYCQGCKQAWVQAEDAGLSAPPSGDCACTCADGDPRYEDWITDPWVCYCGVIAPFDPYVFPHRDCDGGKPYTPAPLR